MPSLNINKVAGSMLGKKNTVKKKNPIWFTSSR